MAGGLILFMAPTPILPSFPAPSSQRGSGFLSELAGGGPSLQGPGPPAFPFPFLCFPCLPRPTLTSVPHAPMEAGRSSSDKWD